MNYAQIRHYDVANGTGIRTSLFVSGCTHKCKGCFNEDYQDFDFGEKFTQKQIQTIINYMKEDVISGLTILGGEPLQQDEKTMAEFLEKVRENKRDDQNIWIFSGDKFEDILKDEKKLKILKLCDILVDGPFIEEEKNLRLKFRGSENQRILDIQKSIEKNIPVDISQQV